MRSLKQGINPFHLDSNQGPTVFAAVSTDSHTAKIFNFTEMTEMGTTLDLQSSYRLDKFCQELHLLPSTNFI